jgi:4a-hydroxytetrahydrobiopterin dehydratase
MHKALTKKQITTELKTLDTNWVLSTAGTSISRKYAFRNYMQGFMFVTKVSVHAEVHAHHPEVILMYSSVKITLTTHDLKKLTKLDIDLAKAFDSIYTLSTKYVVSVHEQY